MKAPTMTCQCPGGPPAKGRHHATSCPCSAAAKARANAHVCEEGHRNCWSVPCVGCGTLGCDVDENSGQVMWCGESECYSAAVRAGMK